MLGARNERLLRRGEPAVDVDAEVARLLAVRGRGQEPRRRRSRKRCASW